VKISGSDFYHVSEGQLRTLVIPRVCNFKGKEIAMTDDKALRQQIVKILDWQGAHIKFDAALAGFPPEHINSKVANIPFTPWQLLEHMRIAQWDILEFSRNPDHVSPKFPGGYWPTDHSIADEEAWNMSIAAFRKDLQAMQDLVADESTDLFAPIPHGDGQTILREALLVADHNAYHLGQLIMLRRCLGDWPGG
jgi:hypothetical protein